MCAQGVAGWLGGCLRNKWAMGGVTAGGGGCVHLISLVRGLFVFLFTEQLYLSVFYGKKELQLDFCIV